MVMAVALPADERSEPAGFEEMFERVDRALGLLEAGLPLLSG